MEWLKEPLKITDDLFECQQSSAQYRENITKHFAEKLADYSNIRSAIPSLNDIPLHRIRDGSVVRFRCMIQDMFNPELYFGAYEVKHKVTGQAKMTCGLYRDISHHGSDFEIDLDSTKNVNDERLIYYCISVPGENQWVRHLYKEQSTFNDDPPLSVNRDPVCKRSRDVVGEEEEGMDTGTDVVMPTITTELPVDQGTNNKRVKVNEDRAEDASSSTVHYCPRLYLPWPDENAVAAIVKIYDPGNYSLNDVVEFVGIISMDPLLSANTQQQESSDNTFAELQMEEEESQNPPPSLVPRLHVLRGFPLAHNNPQLPMQPQAQDLNLMTILFQNVRSQLHSVLEDVFHGDSLAADYLICHLISFVEPINNEHILGRCSLNLTNISDCGDDFVERFYQLLSTLVTKSVLLPLSLDNLNNWNFIPTKDYTANRLVSGRLQLSNQTHLVVDEKVLTEGQLNSKGVQNITALEKVIQHHEVRYDFKYNTIDFKMDVPVLILSEKKSMLTTDFVVPVVAKENYHSRIGDFQCLLPQFRTYLSVLRLLPYNHKLTDDVQTCISNYFVGERQRDVKQMTEGILHNILNVSRLLSVSFGHDHLSQEIWDKTIAMEEARKLRLHQ